MPAYGYGPCGVSVMSMQRSDIDRHSTSLKMSLPVSTVVALRDATRRSRRAERRAAQERLRLRHAFVVAARELIEPPHRSCARYQREMIEGNDLACSTLGSGSKNKAVRRSLPVEFEIRRRAARARRSMTLRFITPRRARRIPRTSNRSAKSAANRNVRWISTGWSHVVADREPLMRGAARHRKRLRTRCTVSFGSADVPAAPDVRIGQVDGEHRVVVVHVGAEEQRLHHRA